MTTAGINELLSQVATCGNCEICLDSEEAGSRALGASS